MKRIVYCYLIAGRRLIFTSEQEKSALFLPFYRGKKLSTLVKTNVCTINARLQSPFAQYATTKFNISSTDLSRMFRNAPQLSRFKTLDKVEQFVDLMNKHGLNQDQIANIMRTHPRLVACSVERIMKPKLELLKDFGFKGEHLVKLLTRGSRVLNSNLHRSLLPNMTFLKNILISNDLLIKVILNWPRILSLNLEKIMKPSLAVWEGCGVRGMELANMVSSSPRLLGISSLTPDKIDFVNKIGVGKESKMYKHVLRIVAVSRMETVEAKMQNLQLCGLSPEEIRKIFRGYPEIFTLSKEKVQQNMEFIVNSMELRASFVVTHARLLKLNLKEVMKPRFLVVQKMESMNELYHLKLKSLYTIMMMPETKFVAQIIEGHPEAKMLYSIYEEAIANMLSQKKNSSKVL